MSASQPRPTLADVAAAAGVSPSAVSRAFTPGASIARATRVRVMQAADQLGYAPNLQARALAMRRSGLVLWVIPETPVPFYDRVALALSAQLGELGMGLVALQAAATDPEAIQLARGLRFRPDAAVVASATLDAQLAALLQRAGVPVLQFGRATAAASAPRVVTDNAAGGAAIAGHFLSRGFRRVAMVTGPDDASPARERAEGFLGRMREAGGRVKVIPGGAFSYQAGFRAAAAVARAACQAAFCANDVIAIGLIDGVRQAGIAVPQGLAVAGFDDVPAAGYGAYALTTMRQDAEGLALASVASLAALLRGEAAEDQVLPASLVVRASTGGDGAEGTNAGG